MNEEILELAERIATEAHAGQFRRGGVTPYVEHPRAVAKRVGDDVEAQVVAWLHDVLEDSEHSVDTLVEAGIPRYLVEVVERLTKTKGTRYEDYLERVAACPLATKVKVADMLCNLADDPTERQVRKYAAGLLRLTGEG